MAAAVLIVILPSLHALFASGQNIEIINFKQVDCHDLVLLHTQICCCKVNQHYRYHIM